MRWPSRCLFASPYIATSLFLAFMALPEGICGNGTDAEYVTYWMTKLASLIGAFVFGAVAYLWIIRK
jgi:hypothetical protein